jgi:hypothetical protein
MTARRFSEATGKDYVRHVRTFTAFLGRSPDTASLPPDEFCRGSRPSQAANCRADRNAPGSATLAAIAVAVTPVEEFGLDGLDLRLEFLNLANDQA